jgi:AcrR family transcriptional regulator
MKRARQKHQKAERREAILSFARAELEASSFANITMAQIAARVGLVKGTLYLYFATKEELFLELFRQELHSWVWDLETGLDELPKRGQLETFGRLLSRSVMERPNLCKLLVLFQGNLLTNLPESTIRVFRDEWSGRVTSMGLVFERALPFLHASDGAALVRQVIALTAGLHAQGEPRETATQDPFASTFGKDLQCAVTALLRGLRERNRARV